MSSVQEEDEAMEDDDTLDSHLREFVKDFVSHYEAKLDEFGREACVGGVGKTGKIDQNFSLPAAAAVGGALQLVPGVPRAVANAGGKAVNTVWNLFSGRKHRKKAKAITEEFKQIDEDVSLRKILVEAGCEIFRCYESQFAQVSDSDEHWTRAMEKLAKDAVDRSINYIKEHADGVKEIDCDLITKSVVCGSSKGIASLAPLTAIKTVLPNPGRTVFKQGVELSTSELFKKVGLITMRLDGTPDNYYRKKHSGNKASRTYGYRLLFQWESKDAITLLKKLNVEYELEKKTPREEYKYVLNSERVKKISEDVLSEINDKDLDFKIDGIKEGVETVKQTTEGLAENLETVKQTMEGMAENLETVKLKVDTNRSGLKSEESRKGKRFNVQKPVVWFTGRESEVKDTHKKLQSVGGPGSMPGVAAITGLGGIGKSELSRKYAQMHAEDYDGNVLWINAENNETLRDSFRKLADDLSIPTRKKMDDTTLLLYRDVGSIVKDVYRYFSRVKSLLIFDNAENFRGIKEFLPCTLHPGDRKPYILITSRNQEWEMGGEGEIGLISLKEFNPKDSKKFVIDFLDIKDNMEKGRVKELTKELQHFPLALRQAVVYIKQVDGGLRAMGDGRFGICAYLKKYEQSKRILLDKGYYKDSDRYTRTVLTTWVATLEKIHEKENGELATDILNVMAYLAPDVILVKEIFSELIPEDVESNPVMMLSQYSMINLDDGVCDIHRLVQQVIRLRLEDENQEEAVLRRSLGLVNNGNISEKSVIHVTSVWTYASKYGDLIQEFYFKSHSISTYGDSQATPLHLLAENGNGRAVEAMIGHVRKEFPDKFSEIINAEDCYDRTPLCVASENGHVNVVQHLLNNGAVVYAKYGALYGKPLFSAIRNGHKDIVQILVASNKSLVNSSDRIGRSPADFAACEGQVAIVESLEPGNKEYLLHAEFCAAIRSHKLDDLVTLMKDLEEKKQLEGVVNFKLGKFTLLLLAVSNNWLDIVEILLRNGASVRDAEDSFTPLHVASSEGRTDMVKRLVSAGANPTLDVTEDGSTSLHVAAVFGKVEVLRYFVDDLGNDVNITDKEGCTPLHVAAHEGKLEVVEFLMDRGANIDAVNVFGATPIFYSAKRSACKVFKFLLNKGANVTNAADKGTLIGGLNLSVLHVAAAFNQKEIIEDLIMKGVYKNVGRDDSITPLLLAGYTGSIQAVLCLICYGADRSVSVHLSKFADMSVELENALRSRWMFMFAGKLINAVSSFAASIKTTPGMICDAFNSSDRRLLDGKRNNSFQAFVRWILSLEGMWYAFYSLKMLMEEVNHPDLNRPIDAVSSQGEGVGFTAKDRNGNTALHLAVKEGKPEFVFFLLKGKAGIKKIDPSIRNKDGKTPLELALDESNKDLNNRNLKEIISYLCCAMFKGQHSSHSELTDCENEYLRIGER